MEVIELPKAIQKNEEEINKELKEEVRNEIQEDIKEEEKEDIKTEVKEEEKEVEENFQKIYIGPTIAEFSLQEYTIFVNGYPSNIEEAIKKYPLTEKLFINVKDLNLKNNEYYRTLYNTLKNEIRGNINGI
jgi:probable inactive protein kinase DDB_G0270444